MVVLLAIILAGCTPLLVKKDKPIILNNATGLSEDQTLQNADTGNEVLIKGINSSLIDGLVYDIADDGKTLLMSALSSSTGGNVESATYYSNLHTYNIQNKQLKQIITSSKEQSNAIFDKKNKGIIYVEYNKDEDGQAVKDSYRLNWSNYEGSTTKNISISDESVSPKFSIVNENLIIYGNTKGQIKTVQVRNIPHETIARKTFNLSKTLDIYKVDYYEDYNLAFFLALNPESKTMDLYYTLLNGTEVTPNLLQKNVTDFDISPKNKSVLFNVSGEKGNQLISVDMKYNRTVIHEGPVSMFYYTPDENKIIYGEKVDVSSHNQNLWIMRSDGSGGLQLASNLKIAGDKLIFGPDENSIFFSVFQLENSESTKLSYKVYMIEFSYSN